MMKNVLNLHHFCIYFKNRPKSDLVSFRFILYTLQWPKNYQSERRSFYLNSFCVLAGSAMTYAEFIWASSMELGPGGWDWGLEAWIRALRLGFELWGCDFSFKAEISASRLGFELWGWDLSFEVGIWASGQGFELGSWYVSFEARIWASRLGFVPWDWDLSLRAGIWASRLGF